MSAVGHGGAPAKNPCGTCPYRKDCPPGFWHRSEYDKLPKYDGPTGEQEAGAFFCHQQDGRLCAGWVGCHDMRESLALRLATSYDSITLEAFEAAADYTTTVPLWSSGQEARDHGLSAETPDAKAQRLQDRLLAKNLPHPLERRHD